VTRWLSKPAFSRCFPTDPVVFPVGTPLPQPIASTPATNRTLTSAVAYIGQQPLAEPEASAASEPAELTILGGNPTQCERLNAFAESEIPARHLFWPQERTYPAGREDLRTVTRQHQISIVEHLGASSITLWCRRSRGGGGTLDQRSDWDVALSSRG